jgi:hypothetical protein
MKGKAPTFVVSALKDPDSGNLDRAQIVKGWSISGQSFEKVYDVVWAGDRKADPTTGKVPAIRSTVDLTKGTYTNSVGATELTTVWTDPDFDAGLDAFYYVRVLEIPTPRWSTMQAVQLGRVPPSGPGFTAVIQERAWSTPIWYTPNSSARARVKAGLTVAELERGGAKALSNTELEALVVGRTLDVHNTVTGRRYQVLYGAKGTRLVVAVDGQPTDPAEAAELYHAGEIGYDIRDGRVVSELDGAPFEIAVYKQGDKYVAARSNEFGYANYELAPAAPSR